MPLTSQIPGCTFRYDPLGRVVGLLVTDETESQRFYCKSRLVTEVQETRHFSVVQHGDQILAQHKRDSDELDTEILATDQMRSVLNLIRPVTGPQPSTYAAYGHRHTQNGYPGLLGFNGERANPITGHYLLGIGYRAFNPVLMRFNSPDSWSPFGRGGLNAYAYCSGDPVNFVDPDGHMKFQQPIAGSNPRVITVVGKRGGPDSQYSLAPLITREQGEKALRQMNHLRKIINGSTARKEKYDLDLRYEVLFHRSLQKSAITTIKSNGIPTNLLPPKLQKLVQPAGVGDRHTLLKWLENGVDKKGRSRYSLSKLNDLADGRLDRPGGSSALPAQADGFKYRHELFNSGYESHAQHQKEMLRIRSAHFEDDIHIGPRL